MGEPGSIRILFDGDCPLCQRKIAFLQRRDRRRKLQFCDIRQMPHLPKETGIPPAQLEKQIHAVLPDGSVLGCMDAVRAAYRAVGLGWLTAPTGWPLLRPLFDWLYAIVAKYRMPISRIVR